MSTHEEDGWITIEAYCQKYGERRNTVHARVNTGKWERGVHYSLPDSSSGFVHEARARAWVAEHPRGNPGGKTREEKAAG
jgi:hypothetical protein